MSDDHDLPSDADTAQDRSPYTKFTDADDDEIPSRPPQPVRQKSREEEKEEEDSFLPMATSLRRQRSFEHTLRPAPFLGEQRETEFQRILRAMGFSEGDILAHLKDLGDKDVAIEDLVKELVEKRKATSVELEPKPKEVKEVKGDYPDGDELPAEPLTLTISNSYAATDWKCRFCKDHINSSHTEVCVQCNRARSLCEELSMDQEERKARDAKRKEEDEKQVKEMADLYQRQQEVISQLELGVWPCRFCDALSPGDFSVCKVCLSPKYLTRLLYSTEEWMSRLTSAQEEEKQYGKEEKESRDEWERKKRSGGQVECGICFDDVSVKKMVFASCKHNFCVTCWDGYLETKVKDGDVMKLNCPAPKCRRALERKEIKARLSPPMWEKYNRFYTQALLSLNPNARWCPTPDCDSVMIGSKSQPRIQCPKCKHEICFLCNHDWHMGTCERAARGLMGMAADRATFAAYAMVNINMQPCPRCRVPIEKNLGCNHMTCQRCRFEFCWQCGGAYYGSWHQSKWNLWGCPGGVPGPLICLNSERCFCCDDCCCGLFRYFRKFIFGILYLAVAAACCPCLTCYCCYICCK